MLTSSLRPAVSRATCAHCLRLSTRRSSSRPIPTSTSSRAPGQARGQASYAQANDKIQLDHDDDPRSIRTDRDEPLAESERTDSDERLERDEGKARVERTDVDDAGERAMDDLLSAFEVQGASKASSEPRDSAPPAGESGPSRSSSDTRAESSPSPPPRPVEKRPTLEELISKPVSGEPTLEDLFHFAPKRLSIPSANAPDSHRMMYEKVWDKTYNRVNAAFSKLQMLRFCGPFGMDIDVHSSENDALFRQGTKGKKRKFWKSKRLDQMSKRELIHTVMVLKWGMVDPDMVPQPNRGPAVTDAVPLSDRTLFLLLSPKSPTIPKIASHLGIKVSFSRHPKTGVLSLLLQGQKSGVEAAKAEVESVDELCQRREYQLPRDASSMRPEMYQTVSRLAKAYLEPGSKPDTLLASAVQAKSLARLDRLLSSAFAYDTARSRSSLFATVPTSLAHLRYSLFPYQPLTPLASLSHGSTSTFARLQALSLSPVPVPEASAGADTTQGDREHEATVELAKWSEKMRLERTSRVPIFVGGSQLDPVDASKTTSILSALFRPFERVVEREPGTKFELRAKVGHVVWPLYRGEAQEDPQPTSSSSSSSSLSSRSIGGGRATGKAKNEVEKARQVASGTGFGPVLVGKWGWDRWLEWLGRKETNESVFVPAPSKGYLRSTGVLTPLPSSTSPFDSLFPTSSFSPSSFSNLASSSDQAATPEQVKALDQCPTFESNYIRRLVYHPLSVHPVAEAESERRSGSTPSSPSDSLFETRLEIDLDTSLARRASRDSVPGQPGVHEAVEIRLVRENKVHVLVPTGKNDVVLCLRTENQVRGSEISVEGEQEQGSSFLETLVSNPSQAPPSISFGSTRYFLHTSSALRETISTPPISPPRSLSSSSSSSSSSSTLLLHPDSNREGDSTTSSQKTNPNLLSHEYKTILTAADQYVPEETRLPIHDVEHVLASGSTRDAFFRGQPITITNTGAIDVGMREGRRDNDEAEKRQEEGGTGGGRTWRQVLEQVERACLNKGA
ncbi:hypothetical protein JCM10212_003943 [Sporobolomyces blumeae]